jgi:hypothetical protein
MPFKSVTDRNCSCDWLDKAAREPQNPIVFDPDTNEFHLMFRDGGGGFALIYHCPFCGGLAPESTRDSLFDYITIEESVRLSELTKNLKTESQVVEALGEPDEILENGSGTMHPETGSAPPKYQYFRSLRYSSLSKTADVSVEVGHNGNVGFTFYGKYLGPKQFD